MTQEERVTKLEQMVSECLHRINELESNVGILDGRTRDLSRRVIR